MNALYDQQFVAAWNDAPIEERATSQSIGHPRDPVVSAFFGGDMSDAGVDVNEWTAFNYSAVYRAISLIAGVTAMLPLHAYRRLPKGERERADEHPVDYLLNHEPNDEMDAGIFRETITGHALSWGNGYSEIERRKSGQPLALHILSPDLVVVRRNALNKLVYEYRQSSGSKYLAAEDVLHIPGLSFDGLIGYTPIRLASNAIGLGMATERYGARFFSNDARPGGVLETAEKLDDDVVQRLRESWNEIHQSWKRAHKLAILEQGLKWNAIGLPNQDAQFLETRKFQIVEICRWYGVPPHLLFELDRSTNNNIEAQGIDLLVYCLSMWLGRWERRSNRSLFMPSEKRTFFVEHLVDALLRTDTKTRHETYKTQREGGWASINEIRRRENEPGIGPAGDTFLIPLNHQSTTGENPPADGENSEEVPSIDELLKITEKVVAGQITPDAAKALIAVCFPMLKSEQIESITSKLVPAPPPAEDLEEIDTEPFVEATRSFVDATMSRLLRKEAEAARRAAKKPQAFIAWLDEFYATHETIVRSAIAPAAQMRSALFGRPETKYADLFARKHALRSRADLLEAAGKAQPENLAEHVEACLLNWEAKRLTELVDQAVTLEGVEA